MKYIIYLTLFTISFCNISSLEPELYNPEGVEFVDNYTFSDFVEFNNEIYLVGNDEQFGSQIWKFNGTKDGFKRVTDLSESSDPVIVDTVNDKLIFATSAQNGERINFWSIDSNGKLSMLLKEVEFHHNRTREITYGQNSQRLISNNKMYLNLFNKDSEDDLISNSELVVTDGLKENTKQFSLQSSDKSHVTFYNINNKLLTFDYNSTGAKIQLEILTDENKLKELAVFEGYVTILKNNFNIDKHDKLYFKVVKDNATTDELWATDGTKTGTLKMIAVEDSLRIEALVYDSNISNFVIAKSLKSETEGELKVALTNGNILIPSDNSIGDSVIKIEFIDEINSKLLFYTITNSSFNLWSTDGTTKGTVKILSKSKSYNYTRIQRKIKFNNKIYFLLNSSNGDDILFETDGNKSGTFEKINITSETGISARKVTLSDKTYKNNIIITNNFDKVYFYNSITDSLVFNQKFDYHDTYQIEKYNDILYLDRSDLFFYYNEFSSKFEEIKPNDTNFPSFRFNYDKLLFKDHLYFFADYYHNNEFKLYRIDNTFQTVSNVEAQPTDELNLYPNPTGDFLNISVDEPTSVSIVDLTGKVVMSIESYSGDGINTSQLSTGVYNIILDESTHCGKFVKE